MLRPLCRLLGGFYCITGLAKLPIFHSFSATIVTIFPVPEHVSQVLASIVILLEVTCGLGLFFAVRTRVCAICLSGLTFLFLWILFPAVVLHRPFMCNCFGIIGIRLPTFWECVVDLVLLDLLGAISILWPRRPGAGLRISRGSSWGAIVVLTVMIIAEGSMLRRAAESYRQTPPPLKFDDAMGFLESRLPGMSNHSDRMLLFLLNFQDFTCPLCFQDFVSLADSLKGLEREGSPLRAVALMQEGGAERLLQDNRLDRWIAETGVPFPLLIVPDSIFAKVRFHKSTVAIIDGRNAPLFVAEFPMGPRKRSLALRLLGKL